MWFFERVSERASEKEPTEPNAERRGRLVGMNESGTNGE